MAEVGSNLFEAVYDHAFLGAINYLSDGINLALLTASATPSLATWSNYSDVTNEVPSGGGYPTGGVSLANKTHGVTAANTWVTSWVAVHPQSVGDIVKPATPNGYLYRCVVAGTTGSSSLVLDLGPTTQGNTAVDGSVTWSCVGESVTSWSSDPVTFSNASFSAAYAVIYDVQSGNPTTEPLICLINFGQTLSPSNGTFSITPSANGWFVTTPA